MRIVVQRACLFLLFLPVLLAGGCKPQEAQSAAEVQAGPAVARWTGRFTVATYNVNNLFDTFDNPYTEDESTPPKTVGQLDALAAAIRQIDADVLVLQEVEAGGFLKQFTATRLAGMGYVHVIEAPTTDPRGITVAALSRVPVLKVSSPRFAPLDAAGGDKLGNQFARDLLRLDVEARPGHVLTLYGLHLKSKRDSPQDPTSAAWRLAEARRIGQIIGQDLAREKIERFAIMGDFNDVPGSEPLRLLERITEPPLTDALARVPAAQRITYVSKRFNEPLDTVLLSPRLARERLGEGEILREGALERASDHRPVRVRVAVP